MIKKSSCESEAVPYVLKFRIKLWIIIINFKRMKRTLCQVDNFQLSRQEKCLALSASHQASLVKEK
jgi:hypothetical protein